MKKLILSAIIVVSIVFASCDVLLKTASTVLQSEQPLTTAEVVQGLKEALKVGADTAVAKLNKTDGYFLDKLVKIELPPQTAEVVRYAQKVPGLDKLIDDVVLQINRSAEDAARQAAPVFKQAITSMSISDAWAILNGADTSATAYLRETTYQQLFQLYQPVMQQSLNKPIVAGVSAQKTWSDVTGKWNTFANSLAGKLIGVKTVDVALDEYVTHRALSGLFLKVSDQEIEIRNNINARVTDLLKRVFGKKQN
jgi:hypothetical protein